MITWVRIKELARAAYETLWDEYEGVPTISWKRIKEFAKAAYKSLWEVEG